MSVNGQCIETVHIPVGKFLELGLAHRREDRRSAVAAEEWLLYALVIVVALFLTQRCPGLGITAFTCQRKRE